jgi:hypothetical protein
MGRIGRRIIKIAVPLSPLVLTIDPVIDSTVNIGLSGD